MSGPDVQVQRAARWFWWIAGLSLVNTLLFQSGQDTSFALGLGITTLSNVLFADEPAMAISLSAVAIGFFGLVGWQASQARFWAFCIGLAVYVGDAFIVWQLDDWVALAFHGVVIFFITQGLIRLRQLARDAAPPGSGSQA
ncbi:hypothetical protein AACH06_20055 [Ideonella sp. DXS29W]|uniref:Uncharacterized protein n=1 Tax=Ideonella lacteola TaxID=2984193 RepID=A0ABU9BX03_9BURK